MTRALGVLALLLALAAPAAAQESHLLVIVGLGGDPENSALFHKWASTLVDAARERFQLPAESVIYLGEDPARDPKRINGRSTKEGIEAAIDRLAARARPGDQVFIVLIGHGAAAAGEARFNLPGPDLGVKDYARLLSRFAAQTVVFVNTASASGGFIAGLAGPNRVIITATKTEGERNQTRFGEFFTGAFSTNEADLDKDGRVSLFEAFTWARQRVMDSYAKEREIPTEHPVIDDKGDGKGIDDPGKGASDVSIARTVFLAPDPAARAAAATNDPALKALYEERRAIEGRIAALKASKAQVTAAEYDRQMEQLLLDLARKDREIREKEKKQP
jgi:hypothetical protein